MAMVLNRNLGIFLLDIRNDIAQGARTANAGHVFDANLIRTQLDQFIGHLRVILHRMHRRVGDAQRALRDHARSLRILDRGSDVAHIVQTAERTGNVGALRLLDLIEQLAHIIGHRAHAQTIQRTIQHVRLDARLVERLRPLANRLIRILSKQQINLLKASAIGLYTGKAAHLNNGRSHTGKLIDRWDIFTGRLPHVAEDQAEFYSFLHN